MSDREGWPGRLGLGQAGGLGERLPGASAARQECPGAARVPRGDCSPAWRIPRAGEQT